VYIGKTPTVGNFQVCDAISVVNGQAAYTLQVGGVNVAPESANHMLVSLNGILQKPGSSFTISGSTMTFASNLATGDVIDFVQILGNVLDIGQPSDDTVTAAKLNNDIISGQTALTAEPADTDEFLVSDAGTIKRIDYSLIKGGGITEADQHRVTANITSNAEPISANIERVDDSSFAKIGTGMSVSSGYWTFPVTGLYRVEFISRGVSAADDNVLITIYATTNNSSYDLVALSADGNDSAHSISMYCSALVNVTDTSNVKVNFQVTSIASGSYLQGGTDDNATSFMFTRLGDSQ
jgi:hypothetical protein